MRGRGGMRREKGRRREGGKLEVGDRELTLYSSTAPP